MPTGYGACGADASTAIRLLRRCLARQRREQERLREELASPMTAAAKAALDRLMKRPPP
jgi:hypothetical protein